MLLSPRAANACQGTAWPALRGRIGGPRLQTDTAVARAQRAQRAQAPNAHKHTRARAHPHSRTTPHTHAPRSVQQVHAASEGGHWGRQRLCLYEAAAGAAGGATGAAAAAGGRGGPLKSAGKVSGRNPRWLHMCAPLPESHSMRHSSDTYTCGPAGGARQQAEAAEEYL